jgi:hypothetical protein
VEDEREVKEIHEKQMESEGWKVHDGVRRMEGT